MDHEAMPDARHAGETRHDEEKSAPLLEDWMGRGELARELGISVDTLSRWETQRIGPPCVRVGRRVLYRRGGVQDWLRSKEERAARRSGGRS